MRNLMLCLFLCHSAFATVYRVQASGGDYTTVNDAIQAIVDANTCGNVIEVKAGETFTAVSSTITLKRVAACSDAGPYNVIRSSNQSALGTARVSPTDATNMPAIRVSSSIVQILDVSQTDCSTPAPSYWKVEGMDIGASGSQNFYFLTRFFCEGTGLPYDKANQPSLQSHHIWLNQNYIHTINAGTSLNTNDCVRGDSGGVFIMTGNYLENCLADTADGASNAESHGINFQNTYGPHYIINNHIEAGGIGSLEGGSIKTIHGQRSTGLFYYGNEYYKAWLWRVQSGTTAPSGSCLSDSRGGESYNKTDSVTWYLCVAGTWVLQGAGTSTQTAIVLDKNHWECKNCIAGWMEGNYLHNSWYPTHLNQHGAAFLINTIVDDLSMASAFSGGLRFRNNHGNSTPWVVSHGVQDPSNYRFKEDFDILFTNNLFDNIGQSLFTETTLWSNSSKSIVVQQTTQGKFVWNKTTSLMNPAVDTGTIGGLTGSQAATEFYFGNSVNSWSGNGYFSFDGGAFLWTGPSNALVIATGGWPRNVVVSDASATTCDTTYGRDCAIMNIKSNFSTGTASSAPFLCQGCSFPTAWSTVDMVDYQADGSGDPRLAVTSPYKYACDFRQDCGANIDEVEWSTATATSGALNPYLEFRVKYLIPSTTTASMRYLAYNTEACTTEFDDDPAFGSPAFSSTSDTGDRQRTVSVTGLTSAVGYHWRVQCGASEYTRSGFVWTK